MRPVIGKLRHERETRKLIGFIFKVRNELKSGWPEHVYHEAFVHILLQNDISFVSKPRRPFLHRGTEIHLFEPDLIIDDLLILEFKVLPYQRDFAGEHYAQLIHYLKYWGLDLGLLVNLAPPKVIIKRVVWNEPKLALVEEYNEIRGDLSEEDKVGLRQIRHLILMLGEQYGLGYPETMYRKLLAIEASHHNLPCISDVKISPIWPAATLPTHTSRHLLIADQYLVHIRSFLEYPTQHDFTSTKTYLHCLGLTFGLVVNFSKKDLQIYGVKAN